MRENGNALLWVLLVLFPPIGIIYMWVKKKDFPQKKKIILSVVFAIWTIILIAFGSGGTTENTTTNSNSKNETVTDAKKEDKDSTPVKKVEAVEVTGDLLTTPAFTAEANTSDMVDQIALTAKKYADTLTDEQVATILADVKNAIHQFYTDNATMEKYMWYGYLLDYKYDDSEAKSSLGTDLFQAIKYVYRNAEKVEDSATVENLNQIDKDFLKIEEESMTTAQKNALVTAGKYLNYTAFSYTGLIEQLEYEGYSTEDATFAVDRCGADWNEQAAKCAKKYLDYSSFSRDGLIEQLEYEGFTAEQAEYGVSSAGY